MQDTLIKGQMFVANYLVDEAMANGGLKVSEEQVKAMVKEKLILELLAALMKSEHIEFTQTWEPEKAQYHYRARIFCTPKDEVQILRKHTEELEKLQKLKSLYGHYGNPFAGGGATGIPSTQSISAPAPSYDPMISAKKTPPTSLGPPEPLGTDYLDRLDDAVNHATSSIDDALEAMKKIV
jgi:hypothetical protein